MKKFVSLILVLLLVLTMSFSIAEAQDIPEDYGALGILTKMNITADELNEILAEPLVQLSY